MLKVRKMRLNQKKKMKISIFSLLLISLSGCSVVEQKYEQLIENQIETTTKETEETTTQMAIDIRLVPEFEQVIAAIDQEEAIELKEELYKLSAPITHTQENFNLMVEEMVVYRSNSVTLGTTQNQDKGAIAIINLAITNKSDQAFFFPIEELRLSYTDASTSIYAAQGLYPLESGNLLNILMNNNGEVPAGETVEGYLVYGLGEQEAEALDELEGFYLTVTPPVIDKSNIIGLTANELGLDLPMFLPLTAEQEQLISLNSSYIQDRISAEWWGNKTILASENINQILVESDVAIKIKRIEVSELELFEEYKESFQFFPNGQVIVSIEFDIENYSNQPILPIDSIVNLTIDNSTIHSEYSLINEYYGQELLPGNKKTVIKTFALDKMTYEQLWQDKALDFEFEIIASETQSHLPNQLQSDEADETTEANEEQSLAIEQVEEFIQEEDEPTEDNQVVESDLVTNEMKSSQFFTFSFQPKLLLYINSELEVVTSLDLDEEDEDEEKVEETTETTLLEE